MGCWERSRRREWYVGESERAGAGSELDQGGHDHDYHGKGEGCSQSVPSLVGVASFGSPGVSPISSSSGSAFESR